MAHSPRKGLTIENLEVTFATRDGVVKAVDGVCLEVSPGETLGVVGESGAGKSVLSLAVMGLLPAKRSTIAGSVWLDGEDLLAAPARAMRGIRGRAVAMIFQDPFASLHPMYRVGDQIAEAGTLHGMNRRAAHARAHELLERVGIGDAAGKAHAYPHQLSGGMRQRAMIAMALMNRPSILIADEPTTALDVTVQAQILDLIRDVKAEFDIGVLLISHDLAVVGDVADRVAVMYSGRIMESGITGRVLSRPRHPYTRGLLDSVPPVDRRVTSLTSIKGAPPSGATQLTGCPFHPRCSYQIARCVEVRPYLRSIEAQHLAACHRSDELAGSTRAGVNAVNAEVLG